MSQRLSGDLQRIAAEALGHDVMIIRSLLYEEDSFVDRYPAFDPANDASITDLVYLGCCGCHEHV